MLSQAARYAPSPCRPRHWHRCPLTRALRAVRIGGRQRMWARPRRLCLRSAGAIGNCRRACATAIAAPAGAGGDPDRLDAVRAASCSSSALYPIAPKPPDGTPFQPVPWVLGAFLVFTLVRLALAYRRVIAAWFLAGSVVARHRPAVAADLVVSYPVRAAGGLLPEGADAACTSSCSSRCGRCASIRPTCWSPGSAAAGGWAVLVL